MCTTVQVKEGNYGQWIHDVKQRAPTGSQYLILHSHESVEILWTVEIAWIFTFSFAFAFHIFPKNPQNSLLRQFVESMPKTNVSL